MTHLGMCSLVAAADLGVKVVGFDKNKNKINKLKKNIFDIYEPQLGKLIDKNKKRITFTSDYKNIVDSVLVYISQDINNSDLILKNKINIDIYKFFFRDKFSYFSIFVYLILSILFIK